MKREEFIQKEAECIYNGGFCFYHSIVNKKSMSVLSLLADMVIDRDSEALESLNDIINEKGKMLERLEDYQKYNYAVAIRNSLVNYVRNEKDLQEDKKIEAVEDLRSLLKYFDEPETYPDEVYDNTARLLIKAKRSNRPYKILVKQF